MDALHDALPTGPVPATASGLRTVDPLVIEASRGTFLISSPRTAKRLKVEPHVLDLLLSARDGLDENRSPTGDRGTVHLLVEHGFLVTGNGSVPAPWDTWGITAWSFHQRVRDTPFIDDSSPGLAERYARMVADRPQPSSLRPPPTDRILLLPRVRTQCESGYLDVLQNRRTHRHFEDRPLDLDRFSDLLHYSFAPLRFTDAGAMGTLQLRAAASGGARHECEAFVLVFNVDHVEPGLYAYDGVRHGLVPLDRTVTREQVEWLTFRQRFFTDSAFGVFTASVADRMAWKYRHPRAYKLMLQNVGHVAQVFSMTAHALGLGAAVTGAIRDTETDDLLGLDTPMEFTTFAMACGFPRKQQDGLPLGIRTPRRAPEGY
ncbi:SagB/ThcOx family dehydrogenase [Kitasatospora sp. NPDC088783]|uniref:SagB/ThcOx family dehydrogenase n=1 Tax=Kitasatospora sp. NPDC088783 TaxID=3364077 RepID=UPI003819A34A